MTNQPDDLTFMYKNNKYVFILCELLQTFYIQIISSDSFF